MFLIAPAMHGYLFRARRRCICKKNAVVRGLDGARKFSRRFGGIAGDLLMPGRAIQRVGLGAVQPI
jgi:hypothetical protein